MKPKQRIKNKLTQRSKVLILLCIVLVSIIVLMLKLIGIQTGFYISSNLELYRCIERSEFDYDCIYENALTTDYQNNFTKEEFLEFFDENFKGCFIQTNPLTSILGNNLLYSKIQKINDFQISDDVCVELVLDLEFEDGGWKIDNLQM